MSQATIEPETTVVETAERSKIKREAFVHLCQEIGLVAVRDDAKNWPNARLLMKAKKLGDLLGATEPEIDTEARATLTAVMDTLKDNPTITPDAFFEAQPKSAKTKAADANGVAENAEPKKRGRKPKESKEGNTPAPSKDDVEAWKKYVAEHADKVDRFGSRLGSVAAKVNAAISKEPKSTEQIMTEAGIADKKNYKQNHLRHLLEKGCIKKTAEGLWHEAD